MENWKTKLKKIQSNNEFLKTQNAKISQEQKQKRQKENKQIPFNCWIMQEQKNEQKFLKNQTNKTFLQEQFLKDTENDLKGNIDFEFNQYA